MKLPLRRATKALQYDLTDLAAAIAIISVCCAATRAFAVAGLLVSSLLVECLVLFRLRYNGRLTIRRTAAVSWLALSVVAGGECYARYYSTVFDYVVFGGFCAVCDSIRPGLCGSQSLFVAIGVVVGGIAAVAFEGVVVMVSAAACSNSRFGGLAIYGVALMLSTPLMYDASGIATFWSDMYIDHFDPCSRTLMLLCNFIAMSANVGLVSLGLRSCYCRNQADCALYLNLVFIIGAVGAVLWSCPIADFP